MNQTERRDKELAYIADQEVAEEMIACRRILQKLNFMDRSDFEGISGVVKELLGAEGAFINPPFYCDYGTHIKVGKNFFANYNCTIIDVVSGESSERTIVGRFLNSRNLPTMIHIYRTSRSTSGTSSRDSSPSCVILTFPASPYWYS